MNNFLKKYKNYIVFLILLFFLIGLKVINPSFIKSVSFLSFDLYQKIFPLKKQSSAVVIVAVDEKSLVKFGQFPWSRNVFAKIVENINKTDPKAIGFDIFFTEKDKQTPEEIIKAYNIDEADYHFNKTEIMKMMMEDGFGTYNWDSLFQNFKRISLENKS